MNSKASIPLEQKVVDEIVHALQATICDPDGPEMRSCIKHGVEFLEDHLRRLYGMEESGDLLHCVILDHPELTGQVHQLQSERDTIRAKAHRLVLTLEDSSAPSGESLQEVMREVHQFIVGILRHENRERAVLIDSTNVDLGGEA